MKKLQIFSPTISDHRTFGVGTGGGGGDTPIFHFFCRLRIIGPESDLSSGPCIYFLSVYAGKNLYCILGYPISLHHASLCVQAYKLI